MLQCYPALRLRFRNEGGALAQELRSYSELPEETRRLRVIPDADAAAGTAPMRPFGPVLLRGTLGTVAGGAARLLIEVHHALVDDQSVVLALRYFAAVAAGEAVPGGETGEAGYLAAVGAIIDAAAAARAGSAGYWRGVFARPATAAVPCWGGRGQPGSGGPGEMPGHYRQDLDVPAVDRLRSIARRSGASVAMLMQAALAIVGHRYGLREPLSVGVPISVRDHPAVGFRHVGLFDNVLPLVAEVTGQDSFRDVVKATRNRLIDLLEHKFTPLSEIADVAGVRRSAVAYSATSYFGVILAVHEDLGDPGRLGGNVQWRGKGNPGSALSIEMVTGSRGGHIGISWPGGSRPWPSPDRLAGHLMRTIEAIGADPDRPVGAYPLMTAGETEQATLRLNGRTAPRPAADPGGVPARVWTVCGKEPSRIAVVDGEHRWTQARLRGAVSAARSLLRRSALPAGSRVGVAFGRSRWQIALALACWLEGLCYVPLDTRGPADRNRFICRDAGLSLVAGHPAVLARACHGVACPVVPVDALPVDRVDVDGAGPADPDAIAYILYTSGSSGLPKGVMVTHGNLASITESLTAALPDATEGAWLAETAPTFDMSIVEMIWPLTNGQAVILSDPAAEYRGGRPVEPFAHRQSTPSRARQVLRAREIAAPVGHWQVQPSTWILGGEALTASLLAELRSAYPDTTFVNGYGPTETTVFASYYVAGAAMAEVPLGGPLDNTVLYIADEYGYPAPEGVTGELLIGGRGVAAGYVNRPELTAAAFTCLDGPGFPGTRVYRSGDRVVAGPDGHLYFRGRRDGQVKIRGHRIETGEVEEQLAADPSVAEAVVLCAGDAGSEELVAVVTARPGATVDRSALRVRLSARLPDVMVPATIAVARSLPMLSSGKVDRREVLRLWSGTGRLETVTEHPAAEASGGPAGPPEASATAAALAEIVAELIGRPVGCDANFFDAGGNSISALRLVAAARERDIELDVRDVFEQQTVRRMAARAETGREARLRGTRTPEPRSRSGPC
jgi:amino acid adenylation domain-containing protein